MGALCQSLYAMKSETDITAKERKVVSSNARYCFFHQQIPVNCGYFLIYGTLIANASHCEYSFNANPSMTDL